MGSPTLGRRHPRRGRAPATRACRGRRRRIRRHHGGRPSGAGPGSRSRAQRMHRVRSGAFSVRQLGQTTGAPTGSGRSGRADSADCRRPSSGHASGPGAGPGGPSPGRRGAAASGCVGGGSGAVTGMGAGEATGADAGGVTKGVGGGAADGGARVGAGGVTGAGPGGVTGAGTPDTGGTAGSFGAGGPAVALRGGGTFRAGGPAGVLGAGGVPAPCGPAGALCADGALDAGGPAGAGRAPPAGGLPCADGGEGSSSHPRNASHATQNSRPGGFRRPHSSQITAAPG